jgi:uncharacterized protein YabN with tetrapyrrole methylase and pyrophosphatase domain
VSSQVNRNISARTNSSAPPCSLSIDSFISSIKGILPHRHPFLFVDRVIEYNSGERIVTEENISEDEEEMHSDWRRSVLNEIIASSILIALVTAPLGMHTQCAEAGENASQKSESDWQKAKRETGEATDSVGAAIKETAGKAWGTTKRTATKVWDATKETSRKAWNATKEAASDAGDAVKEGAKDAGDAIKGD